RLRHGLALAILAAASAAPGEMSTILVEDWSSQPQGRAGIPQGWSGHSWGSPKYDFTAVADGAERVLHLQSHGDNSTISKEITVDVKAFPLLVRRWKVVTLPAGGDCRRRAAEAAAAQGYVVSPRVPREVG